jgi:hypothetical protein
MGTSYRLSSIICVVKLFIANPNEKIKPEAYILASAFDLGDIEAT